jgi:two-component system response regulator HydG
VVHRALESLTLRQENEQLKSELCLSRTMVFASKSMGRLALLASRVAPRDVTVLITGESGTGKERLAETMVQSSPRAGKPFVRFNCASLSPDLAEAELFGHARGAFTGAIRSRRGVFGEADGGTILLDEIGELNLAVQAKLLRVLQEGEIRSVGEEQTRAIDVRIIAATHRDLASEVKRGAFREDLFYRLNVVTLAIPPLRERPEDIPVLVRFFLGRLAARFQISPPPLPETILARLITYAWPGNVRELENTLERLLALSPEGEWDSSLLPDVVADPTKEGKAGLREQVDAYERGLILECLKLCAHNRSEAARRLGISRVTLHDKLKKFGIGD